MAALVGCLLVLAGGVAFAQVYGARGYITTDFDHRTDVGQGAVVQPDGSLVVAGWAQDFEDTHSGFYLNSYGDDVALARYRTSGALDHSFSHNGKVRTDVHGEEDDAFAIARQPDGKLLVAGRTFNISAPGGLLLARYNRNGSLDRSFGDDGLVEDPAIDAARDLAIGRDGKIVVAGNRRRESEDFAVARYEHDGRLDRSFSHDGRKFTDFGHSDYDVAYAVAIERDGRIVVGGSGGDPVGFALARYRRHGGPDETFSEDGKVVTSSCPEFCPEANAVQDLALTRHGRILAVGGSLLPCGGTSLVAARYRPDGALDPNFSGDGRLIPSAPGDRRPLFNCATAVALRQGSIILAGEAAVQRSHGIPNLNFAVARLDFSGHFEHGFSRDGLKVRDLGTKWDAPFGMAVDNGRAYVVGTTLRQATSWDWGVARFRLG